MLLICLLTDSGERKYSRLAASGVRGLRALVFPTISDKGAWASATSDALHKLADYSNRANHDGQAIRLKTHKNNIGCPSRLELQFQPRLGLPGAAVEDSFCSWANQTPAMTIDRAS